MPNAQQDKVPEEYIRKQTLTNAERYITNELKKRKPLSNKSQQAELEKQLYAELESTIESFIQPLQLYAQVIAHVDAMASLAHVAQTQGFSKPIIHPATNRSLMNGLWHPMVVTNQKQPFIRNSIALPKINRSCSLQAQTWLVSRPLCEAWLFRQYWGKWAAMYQPPWRNLVWLPKYTPE